MSDQTTRLRPCPFCGEAYDLVREIQDAETHFVSCDSCGATGPPSGEEALAAELWNGVRLDGPDPTEALRSLRFAVLHVLSAAWLCEDDTPPKLRQRLDGLERVMEGGELWPERIDPDHGPTSVVEAQRDRMGRLRSLVELAAAYVERQPCLHTAEEAPAAEQLVARLRAGLGHSDAEAEGEA